MRRLYAAVPAVLFCAGCLFSTSDDIAFQAADAGADVDATPDATTPGDAARDTATDDGNEDADDDDGLDFGRPDLSSGGICPEVPAPQGSPTCNPVTRAGCGAVEICDIGIDTAVQPPQFFYECRAPRPLELSGGTRGDACDAQNSCRWGHRCVQGTCHAYCQFADGLGCAESEQCDVFFDADQITHFGLCVNSCGELRGS